MITKPYEYELWKLQMDCNSVFWNNTDLFKSEHYFSDIIRDL